MTTKRGRKIAYARACAAAKAAGLPPPPPPAELNAGQQQQQQEQQQQQQQQQQQHGAHKKAEGENKEGEAKEDETGKLPAAAPMDTCEESADKEPAEGVEVKSDVNIAPGAPAPQEG